MSRKWIGDDNPSPQLKKALRELSYERRFKAPEFFEPAKEDQNLKKKAISEAIELSRTETGLKDETGRMILSGDDCLLDNGFSHKIGFPNGFPGFIEQSLDGKFWFVHKSNGDKIPLSSVYTDIEVVDLL